MGLVRLSVQTPEIPDKGDVLQVSPRYLVWLLRKYSNEAFLLHQLHSKREPEMAAWFLNCGRDQATAATLIEALAKELLK